MDNEYAERATEAEYDTVKAEPQVQSQMMQLSKVAAEATELVEQLERRLENVLRQADDAVPTEADLDVMLVPVADGIRSDVKRLARVNRRLASLLQRIEV